jgi:hypothetical protein
MVYEHVVDKDKRELQNDTTHPFRKLFVGDVDLPERRLFYTFKGFVALTPRYW